MNKKTPILSPQQKKVVQEKAIALEALRLGVKTEDMSLVRQVLENSLHKVFVHEIQTPNLLSCVSDFDSPFAKDLLIYLLTKDNPLLWDPFDEWRESLSYGSIKLIAEHSSEQAEKLATGMVKHNMFLQLNRCLEYFPVNIQEKICQWPETLDRMKKYPQALSNLLEASNRFTLKKDLLQGLGLASQSKPARCSKM